MGQNTGEMAEEERRRQKTASTWATHGSPIWIPKEGKICLANAFCLASPVDFSRGVCTAGASSAGAPGAEMSFVSPQDK